MKLIILLALCSAALAVAPSAPVTFPSTKNLGKFSELILKYGHLLNKETFTRLMSTKSSTRTPGVREVLDFLLQEVYWRLWDDIDRISIELVDLIRQHDLNDLLQAELPGIVQKAGEQAYYDTAGYIGFWKWYSEVYFGIPYPKESIVENFITMGLTYSAVDVPLYTYYGTLLLLQEQRPEAAARFETIMTTVAENSYNNVVAFLELLDRAINCEQYGRDCDDQKVNPRIIASSK